MAGPPKSSPERHLRNLASLDFTAVSSALCYYAGQVASRLGGVMTTALRPLSTGELLDRTFSLYRSHFGLFVGILRCLISSYLEFSFYNSRVNGPIPGSQTFSPHLSGF